MAAEPAGEREGGDLAFEALSVGPVRALDLRVGAGEFLGIRADGVMAEALVDFLAARRAADSGRATLGRTVIDCDEPEVARRSILVAPHEAALFDGTIADNLRIADPSPARLADVLAATAADEVLTAVPHGIDTTVGEGGRQLSGGQRQRVALARALLADAPVLVLHDPTTAVDSVTEHRIAAGLRRIRTGGTTIVITSSPHLLGAADRVIDLGPAT